MAEIEVVKSNLTLEDLELGTGTVEVPTSDGLTRPGTKINAASIPLKVAGAADSDLTATNVDDALSEIMGAVDTLAADTYSADEVDGLLSTKSDTGHGHAISDVTGLQGALDGKSATGHTHSQSDITGLTTALAAKAPLASPTFTGTPTAPTAAAATDTTQVATTAFVKTAIDSHHAASSADHDDRYYTETEVDAKLAAKSDTGHTHDDRYYTETEADTALATKAALAGSSTQDFRAQDFIARTVSVNSLPLMDPDTHEFEYGAGYPPVHHRTGSATYLSTAGTLTTAGDGVARIGLPWVVRRNLFKNSSDLQAATWSLTRMTATANQAIAPDGTATAFKLQATGTAGEHYLREAHSITGDHTVSACFKKGSYRYVGIRNGQGSLVSLDLETGAIINTPAGYTASVEALADGWYRLKVKFTRVSGTEFAAVMLSNASGAISITSSSSDYVYVWQPQFEAASSASPIQPTKNDAVDLTHPLNGAGLVLEGSTTNRLVNPSLADATADGFADNWSAGSAGTFSNSNGEQTFTATAIYGAVAQTYNHGSATGPWAFSVDVKATSPSVKLVVYLYDSTLTYLDNVAVAHSGSGNFERLTVVANRSDVRQIQFRIEDQRASGWNAVTFRRPQAEINAFPTSWVDGTRQPDLCGIVSPHNLLMYSEQFDGSAWSALGSPNPISANYATAPDGTTTADRLSWGAIGVDTGTGQTINVEGLQPYTISVWVKSNTASDQFVRFMAAGTYTNDFTASPTEWRRIHATFTPGADGTLRFNIMNGSTGYNNQDLLIWGAQIVEGSHPGIYVPTTDTPIPAPVSPALDPAWQQNGRVRFRVLPPPISTGKGYNLIGAEPEASVSNPVFRLIRAAGTPSSAHDVYFQRRHNGSTGAFGEAGRAQVLSIATLYDGAPHDVEMEWTNEIRESDGLREMWMRVWIDGVLVAQQDVAALYGATAWAEIDPSRLISDGNCFSVISDLALEYPVLPAGSIPAV